MQQQSPEPILTATTDPASSLSFGQAREIAQSHHFVFLCGLHRSGTTLLFRMLRSRMKASFCKAYIPRQCVTEDPAALPLRDRKSTRLNSSHLGISYAVFCL